MEVEQIKQMLKELSEDDLKALKEFINAENVESESKSQEENQETDNKETTDNDTQSETDETPQETTETDEKKTEKVDDEQADEEEEKTDLNSFNEPTEVQEDVPTEEEPIPTMQKGEPANEEKVVEQPTLESDDGNELPIDFEQIIEAQNAKIAALEAENASLKSKVDSAFGYSAKVSMPTKTNKLYDECSDVHFHR